MVTILVHRDGRTEQASSLDRAWLNPASNTLLWVDLESPSIPESLILSDTFAFHPLSVEDAMSARQYPKAEAYDGYLYIILHGIAFQKADHCFETQDVDFFLGPNYLVTVHSGGCSSIQELRAHATRNPKIFADGPVALFHRVVDAMVDHYRPEMDKLEDRLDEMENNIFESPNRSLMRQILAEKRQVPGWIERLQHRGRDGDFHRSHSFRMHKGWGARRTSVPPVSPGNHSLYGRQDRKAGNAWMRSSGQPSMWHFSQM
jgi:magnesium transporter